MEKKAFAENAIMGDLPQLVVPVPMLVQAEMVQITLTAQDRTELKPIFH